MATANLLMLAANSAGFGHVLSAPLNQPGYRVGAAFIVLARVVTQRAPHEQIASDPLADWTIVARLAGLLR
jgi:hypothetical protein